MIDNNIASNNFSQNTFAKFNIEFKGLEKTVGLFFPSLRNAIVERYRAETFYKIGMQTEKIIKVLGIETHPIPPKAALPLFEKSSLEHEEDMYDMWAQLLAGAIDKYNPIHIQYAEILSKIGKKEAECIYKLYIEQKKHFKENTEKYVNFLDKEELSTEGHKYLFNIMHRFNETEVEKIITFKFQIDNIFLLLKNIGLIDIIYGRTKNSKNKFYIYAYLTEFGYKLVDDLEKYNIKKVI